MGDDDEICDNTNYREKEAKNKRKWIELCKRRDKEEKSILNPQKERINKSILYKKQFPYFGNGHIVPASSSLCYRGGVNCTFLDFETIFETIFET